METDKELLEDFARTRNIKNTTKRIYQASIELYAKYNEKTMVELIQEAETEEEKCIRWKHRKIKKKTNRIQNILNRKLPKKAMLNQH